MEKKIVTFALGFFIGVGLTASYNLIPSKEKTLNNYVSCFKVIDVSIEDGASDDVFVDSLDVGFRPNRLSEDTIKELMKKIGYEFKIIKDPSYSSYVLTRVYLPDKNYKAARKLSRKLIDCFEGTNISFTAPNYKMENNL